MSLLTSATREFDASIRRHAVQLPPQAEVSIPAAVEANSRDPVYHQCRTTAPDRLSLLSCICDMTHNDSCYVLLSSSPRFPSILLWLVIARVSLVHPWVR